MIYIRENVKNKVIFYISRLQFPNFILICTNCDYKLKLCISGVNALLDMSPVSKAWSTSDQLLGEKGMKVKKRWNFQMCFPPGRVFFLRQAVHHPG